MSAYDPSLLGMENVIAFLAAVVIPLVVGLIVNIIIGVIAVNMAKKRDLRPVPAFFIGFLSGFIGLFIVALTPKRY